MHTTQNYHETGVGNQEMGHASLPGTDAKAEWANGAPAEREPDTLSRRDRVQQQAEGTSVNDAGAASFVRASASMTCNDRYGAVPTTAPGRFRSMPITLIADVETSSMLALESLAYIELERMADLLW